MFILISNLLKSDYDFINYNFLFCMNNYLVYIDNFCSYNFDNDVHS